MNFHLPQVLISFDLNASGLATLISLPQLIEEDKLFSWEDNHGDRKRTQDTCFLFGPAVLCHSDPHNNARVSSLMTDIFTSY